MRRGSQWISEGSRVGSRRPGWSTWRRCSRLWVGLCWPSSRSSWWWNSSFPVWSCLCRLSDCLTITFKVRSWAPCSRRTRGFVLLRPRRVWGIAQPSLLPSPFPCFPSLFLRLSGHFEDLWCSEFWCLALAWFVEAMVSAAVSKTSEAAACWSRSRTHQELFLSLLPTFQLSRHLHFYFLLHTTCLLLSQTKPEFVRTNTSWRGSRLSPVQ